MSFSLSSSGSLVPGQATVYAETAQGVLTCCTDTPLAIVYSAPLTIYSIAAVPCTTPGTGANPCNDVPATTADGLPLTDRSSKLVFRPDDGHDPAFFVTEGMLNRDLFNGALANITQLAKFATYNVWDEQRVCNHQPKEVDRAYANIAIGLYAAAANIPLSEVLSISNAFAALFSGFGRHRIYDSTYTNLPADNVAWEKQGYSLYQSNAFQVCPI